MPDDGQGEGDAPPEQTQAWKTDEVDPDELERAIQESERLRRAASARARRPTTRDPALEDEDRLDPGPDDGVRPGAETEELPAAPLSREQTHELVRRRGQGLPAGTVLGGRFRLDEEIGRGAQGLVYRARDLALAREVAVKLLRTDAPGQARQRFEREAKTISRLRHPGIVTVYETGSTEDGALFYAMELVVGRSLEDLLDAEGFLSPERLVPILESVALAIHHAHDAGLIHRDLKPGNVLLDADEERPRIADFGLVSLGNATRLTMTRGVVGTPVYMAPEQAEGERVDRRADVYSLGAILYEGLVGKPPFSGVTPLEIFRRVVEEDPVPLRELRAEVPEALERVCLRTLQKEPGDRYPTAAAFARDLRRALEGQRLAPESPLRAPRRRRRRRKRTRAASVWAGVAIASLGALGGWLLGRRGPPPARVPLQAQGAAALPDPARALKRERALEAARRERARGLPKAALAWLETLAEEGGDPLADRDAARAHALRALCLLDQGDLSGAALAVDQGRRLGVDERWLNVAAAALAGPAELEQVLREGPGLVEGWLALAQLAPDPAARRRALSQAVSLGEPLPWPVALRDRARSRLAAGELESAQDDVFRLLERVGGRDGFEVERAVALWPRDPSAAEALLLSLPQDPQGPAAVALAALRAQPAAARGDGLVGLRLQAVERHQVTRRLQLVAGESRSERTEVEIRLARYTDRVLAVERGRATRIERTYDELRLNTGSAVAAITDLSVRFGADGLETALGEEVDPALRTQVEQAGRRFARWGLGAPRPQAERWEGPADELAAGFEVSPDDLAASMPAASGRVLSGSEPRTVTESIATLRLGRYQGLRCLEPATGTVRGVYAYQPGQPWPAEVELAGGYAGRAGWPWGGVSLTFEVAVEAQVTTRLRAD